MIKNLNICGQLNGEIDFQAAIIGHDIRKELYSFDAGAAEGKLRLFSHGSSFTLKEDRFEHHGNGGLICETCFGMPGLGHQLKLFGASSVGKKTRLSELTAGSETYSAIFNENHPFNNTFFFAVFHQPIEQNLADEQAKLAASLGRRIRTLPTNSSALSGSLIEFAALMHSWFAKSDITLYLMRLTRSAVEKFYRELRLMAFEDAQRLIDRETSLQMAKPYHLPAELIERLRLDLVYKHPEKQPVIERYRAVLSRSVGSPKAIRELQELRTVCLRRNIPREILEYIEKHSPQTNEDIYRTEPTHIQAARVVLEEWVLKHDRSITNEQLRVLLNAKFKAEHEGSQSFEKLLLDYSHRADQSKDLLATQLMQSVIQVIHAYEHLVQTLSHFTYVNEAELDAKQLMGLRNHYRQLAAISATDLNRMVVQPLLESLYLTYFGEEKLRALLDFLNQEAVTPASVDTIVAKFAHINQDQRAYNILDAYIRENIRIFYFQGHSLSEREMLRSRISMQLEQSGKIHEPISAEVFSLVLKHLHMESIYLNHILPEMILNEAWHERDDFIHSSDLDLERIESMERAYARRNRLPENYLATLLSKNQSKQKSAIEKELG